MGTWNKCLSCKHGKKRKWKSGVTAVFCAKTRQGKELHKCFHYDDAREAVAKNWNCPKWCPVEKMERIGVIRYER